MAIFAWHSLPVFWSSIRLHSQFNGSVTAQTMEGSREGGSREGGSREAREQGSREGSQPVLSLTRPWRGAGEQGGRGEGSEGAGREAGEQRGSTASLMVLSLLRQRSHNLRESNLSFTARGLIPITLSLSIASGHDMECLVYPGTVAARKYYYLMAIIQSMNLGPTG